MLQQNTTVSKRLFVWNSREGFRAGFGSPFKKSESIHPIVPTKIPRTKQTSVNTDFMWSLGEEKRKAPRSTIIGGWGRQIMMIRSRSEQTVFSAASVAAPGENTSLNKWISPERKPMRRETKDYDAQNRILGGMKKCQQFKVEKENLMVEQDQKWRWKSSSSLTQLQG